MILRNLSRICYYTQTWICYYTMDIYIGILCLQQIQGIQPCLMDLFYWGPSFLRFSLIFYDISFSVKLHFLRKLHHETRKKAFRPRQRTMSKKLCQESHHIVKTVLIHLFFVSQCFTTIYYSIREWCYELNYFYTLYALCINFFTPFVATNLILIHSNYKQLTSCAGMTFENFLCPKTVIFPQF